MSQAGRRRLLEGLRNIDLLTALKLDPSGRVDGCDMVYVPDDHPAQAGCAPHSSGDRSRDRSATHPAVPSGAW